MRSFRQTFHSRYIETAPAKFWVSPLSTDALQAGMPEAIPRSTVPRQAAPREIAYLPPVCHRESLPESMPERK